MKLHVPLDENYVSLLGKAIYLFAYYEWLIIYIVQAMEPGFVAEYSRAKQPMTSGTIRTRFNEAIRNATGLPHEDMNALAACWSDFDGMVTRRNALVHAHPITDVGGGQILHYQTSLSRQYPDLKWDEVTIQNFLRDVDSAVLRADIMRSKLTSGLN